MNLEEMKELIREKWGEVQARLEESPTYDNLKERYMELSTLSQRLILFGSIGGLIILFNLFPFSYMMSSIELVRSYESQKELVQGLLKYSQTQGGGASLPQGEGVSSLISKFRSSLNKFRLLPVQIVEVSKVSDDEFVKDRLKPPIIQSSLKVRLKWLNLQQVVQIGASLQSLKPNVRMLGLEIEEDKEKDNYYNVVYKLVGLSLPVESLDEKKGGDEVMDKKDRKNERGRKSEKKRDRQRSKSRN